MQPTINLRPQAGYGAASLFNTGAKQFTGAINDYADRIQTRAKNQAINELLGAEPIQGNNETSVSQSPLAFQQQQQAKFAAIQDIDPLQALGLAQRQAQPYYDQASTDATVTSS